jgi:Flp pilus assembly protein TadG
MDERAERSATPRDRASFRRRWSAARAEVGQSLVEFAMILPIFLVLLFALADFGRGFYAWMIVTNAAREGARSAAVQDNATTIDSKIYGSFCSNGSSPTKGTCSIWPISISHPTVQGTKGTEAQVTVTHTFTFVTPIGGILRLIGGHSLSAPTISSTTYMRFE